MAYRITPLFDDKNTLETTATIDAAILAAKRLSVEDNAPRLVRDGSRIRVRALAGRAFWMAPCKPCKGTGEGSTISYNMMGGPSTRCERCEGAGVIEDLQCA